MLRVILFLAFALNCAFGMNFSFCQKHYQMLVAKVKDYYAIPIQYNNQTRFLLYSKKPLIAEAVLKADPFIGLYEIAVKKPMKGYNLLELDAYAMENIPVAVLGMQGAREAKVLEKQKGFLEYGKLSQSIEPNEVVGNVCYQIYGIGAEGGFLEKRYIERFLGQEEVYYGDIGVRLSAEGVVEEIDPFFKDNPFLLGDKIIKINGETLQKDTNLEWIIANLSYQSQVQVSVLRHEALQEQEGQSGAQGDKQTQAGGGQAKSSQAQGSQAKVNQATSSASGDNPPPSGKMIQKDLKVIVGKRYGGMLLQDSFFESQGIKIDSDLVIRRLSRELSNGLENLKRGDRILWIDKIDPRKMQGDRFANLRKVLSEAFIKNGFIEMLVSRNGFQFSIKVYPQQ